MKYRLGLDLGSTSLGWAILRLDQNNQPCAIVKTGVRIFPDGRNPQDKSSLAVERRLARQARRRRDRQLQRKSHLINTLINLGFFPADPTERKALELLDPYELRARGLDKQLTPGEFARAIFHLNQRRGFKSNRKAYNTRDDTGAMNKAITKMRNELDATGARTVGEKLNQLRLEGKPLRARYRSKSVQTESGRNKIEKWYDLYIERQMVLDEFNALWQAQQQYDEGMFNEEARKRLEGIIFFQRPLKPVQAGKCSIFPELERAPRALPSGQQLRILQELNNLSFSSLDRRGETRVLSLAERDRLFDILNGKSKLTFKGIRKELNLGEEWSANLEGEKRDFLDGNKTAASLSDEKLGFGDRWHDFDLALQDEIVVKLRDEADESALIDWLVNRTGVTQSQALHIADVGLPEGYGSLSAEAISKFLPVLKSRVVAFQTAKQELGMGDFGFGQLIDEAGQANKVDLKTGEVLPRQTLLPYYGQAIKDHVGFGSDEPEDADEIRYGKIANPTVHIGLNQVRTVVNAIIERYGQPAEIIVELARELKQSAEKRKELEREQSENQKRRDRARLEIAKAQGFASDSATEFDRDDSRIKGEDIEKYLLWEELGSGSRLCPYSGEQISFKMMLSAETEVDHIIPYSISLDDSRGNKVLVTRKANQIKGNRSPFRAKEDFARQGWEWDEILRRVSDWTGPARNKLKKFQFEGSGSDVENDFLARALNDTRHLSRVARKYLQAVVPRESDCRVIPGKMTAMVRRKLGLNSILSPESLKNRSDHRHHAVDAIVIALTDQGMLQRFARAASSAEQQNLDRLLDTIEHPWPTFLASARASIESLKVSHKPDHGYQGQMLEEWARGFRAGGFTSYHKIDEKSGERVEVKKKLQVIPITAAKATHRHGVNDDGSPKAYKGYNGDSNFCIEIYADEKGEWQGEVVSTFQAYQIVRLYGEAKLRDPKVTVTGKPLVMRLHKNDTVTVKLDGRRELLRVKEILTSTKIVFAHAHEANVAARSKKGGDYKLIRKNPNPLKKVSGKYTPVDPIGFTR